MTSSTKPERVTAKVASAALPTIYGDFKVIIYTSSEDALEHTVLIKGSNLKEPLVRIHSSCLTGDVFSSLKCDCREQLIAALKRITKCQNGVLIYLNQEGRGIGLINKIKAYALQEEGLDTIQANKQLGFSADPRSYFVATQILKDMKIRQIKLLTNNPDKVSQLEKYGISVTKVIPLEVNPNKTNKGYLKTKKYKMGHKLKLV